MEIKEFSHSMAREVEGILGEGYKIECTDVLKNNGKVHHGLIIRKAGHPVAPTIYVDQMYETFLRGTSLKNLADATVKIYKNSKPGEDFDPNFYNDFSVVSEMLFFKIVNYRKNKKNLENVPIRRCLDLAMIPLCRVRNMGCGEGSITITKNHLKIWEVSEDELWENIGENAAKVEPYKRYDLYEFMEHLTGHRFDYRNTPSIYVVSNYDGLCGAGAVLYPGVLKDIADEFKSDLYIIPSSIHESIVFPVGIEEIEPDIVRHMIQEVNECVLDPEDVLSSNLYIYSRETDCLSIVKE